MSKFILGRKGRMTQLFTEEGVCIPVTVVEVGPCWVTKLATEKDDGYNSVQLGYEAVREKVLSKAEVGHTKRLGGDVPPLRHLCEFRLAAPSELELGAQINADVFAVGDHVDVVGRSKGRGFAGVMKRYNFKGGRMTHGGMARRRPGSLGMSADPSRVFKGKRMAGHYGDARVTVKNLEVVGVDTENSLLLLRGAVPGHRGSIVRVRSIRTGA